MTEINDNGLTYLTEKDHDAVHFVLKQMITD